MASPLATAMHDLRQEVRALGSTLSGPASSSGNSPDGRLAAIFEDLRSGAVVADVRKLLEDQYASEADPNLDSLLQHYEDAQHRHLPYWDVRTAVRVVARHLRPRTYLEVGTRRGWSLAQAFAECPDIAAYVFEMWVPEYAGAPQGDPDYITAKMQAIVGPERSPRIAFVAGNSHETLPEFFGRAPETAENPAPRLFDLIVVDGDHSRLGAWWDLWDLFPRVERGGALVFDDLEYDGDEEHGNIPSSSYRRPDLIPAVGSLMDLWLYMQLLYPNFLFVATPTLRYRTGLAFRMY
jgi:predicted O-methyltransferase YrrM